MRTSYLIILAAILFVAGGAGLYVFSKPAPQTPFETPVAEAEAITDSTSPVVTDSPVLPFSASLAQVIASGRDLGCHFKSSPEEGDFIATIFVSHGRARGTFVGDLFEGDPLIGYFLINDPRFYAWFIVPQSAPKEYRGKALLVDLAQEPDKEEAKQGLMESLENLYGCVPWEFEEDFFELPTDLKYVDQKELEAAEDQS